LSRLAAGEAAGGFELGSAMAAAPGGEIRLPAKEIEADETSVFIRLSCDEVVR
jgi:hypothetical protein